MSGFACACALILTLKRLQGLSLGVADGVGGWVDSGVDPARFSQALMYHARLRSEVSWAGEPETDPTKDDAEREAVEGSELSPAACLDQAYDGVMLEPGVKAGTLGLVMSNLRHSLTSK